MNKNTNEKPKKCFINFKLNLIDSNDFKLKSS